MRVKQVFLVLMAAIMTAATAACAADDKKTAESPAATASAPAASTAPSPSPGASGSSGLDHSKPLKLTVFSTTANYAGIQPGWFGKIIKDKFNIEMDIVASNLTGGDTKISAMMASGNLGDIVIFGDDKNHYPNAIKGNLLLDWTKDSLLDKHGADIVKTFPKAIQKAKAAFGGGSAVYGIGNNVATNPTGPSEGKDMTWGPDLRWDLYQKIGAPPINSVEDYLTVLKKMQELEPKTEQGKKPTPSPSGPTGTATTR